MQPAPANSPTKCLPPVCRCDPAEGGDAIRLTTVGRPRRLRVRLTQCEHSCSYCGFDAAASLTQSGQKNAMSASRPVDDCGRLHVRKRVCQAVSMKRLLSRGRIELVGPGVDDGFAVNVVDVGEDPRLEFFLGSDADVAEHRACHLEEESFDQV